MARRASFDRPEAEMQPPLKRPRLDESLSQRFNDETHADCVLAYKHGEQIRKIFASKAVLSDASDFFKRLFESSYKDQEKPEVALSRQEPFKYFEDMIRFIYTGECEMADGEILPLLGLADEFHVRSLVEALVSKLAPGELGIEDTLAVLDDPANEDPRLKPVLRKAAEALGKFIGFGKHPEFAGRFNAIGIRAFKRFLTHAQGFQHEEGILFVVQSWWMAHYKNATAESKEANSVFERLVLDHVALPFLTRSALENLRLALLNAGVSISPEVQRALSLAGAVQLDLLYNPKSAMSSACAEELRKINRGFSPARRRPLLVGYRTYVASFKPGQLTQQVVSASFGQSFDVSLVKNAEGHLEVAMSCVGQMGSLSTLGSLYYEAKVTPNGRAPEGNATPLPGRLALPQPISMEEFDRQGGLSVSLSVRYLAADCQHIPH